MTLEDLNPGVNHIRFETTVLKRDRNNRIIEKRVEAVEEYDTKLGMIEKSKWLSLIEEVLSQDENTKKLYDAIVEYVKTEHPWFKSEEDIKVHAASCLCHKSYLHWEDFNMPS